jgi:hypothetical protein
MIEDNELYGDLLTAKEVCEYTGFTMNQLRNWRIPARQDLAPFGYVSIGATPYYRKIVVQDYLDECGPQIGIYVMSERDKKFPIRELQVKSLEENMGNAKLKKITSATVHSWVDTTFESKGQPWAIVWQSAWATIEQALGLEPKFILHWKRWDHPEFWNIAVHAARYIINEEQELGFDLPAILALGDSVAPEKEVKF